MILDRTVDWRGRRIAWGTAGSGPDVVLCHGTPFSSLLWHPFADALAADFRVHVWDMPGYGASSKDADHLVDLGVQAEAFAALLDHWGLDRPHVVAHDVGGAVSLRTHLALAVDYASLLLVDVVAVLPVGSPFFAFVQANADLLGQLPGYVHEAVVRAYVANASHRGLPDDVLDALVAPWIGPDGQPAFYRQIAQFDERFVDEVSAGLPDVRCPVHVVWGEQDTWIPPDRAATIAGLLPSATLTLVPDAGHLVHHDAPVALMSELRRWLTSG